MEGALPHKTLKSSSSDGWDGQRDSFPTKKCILSGQCITFFRRRYLRFDRQLRTENTIYTIQYTLLCTQLNEQFKVQIIDILEEINSLY